MCTAISLKTSNHYFGRTLDYEFSYGESVVIVPRTFEFAYRHGGDCSHHLAMIGTAHVEDGYPLFYDAANEAGLCMAGLNFVGNALYDDFDENDHQNDQIAQFELLPWVLSNCRTIDDAKRLLSHTKVVNTPFSEKLPPSPLHWLVADKNSAITLEIGIGGMKIFDNKIGVLTNNPPFDVQMLMLAGHSGLSPEQPRATIGGDVELSLYSRGMGAVGLPGDLSSPSRFARAAFTKLNLSCGEGEQESLSGFFHVLGTVEQTKGCCKVGDKYEYTIYTSCINADRGIYYYKTYDSLGISAVNMHDFDIDSGKMISRPMVSIDASTQK